MPTTMRAPLTGSPTKDGRWRIALTLTTPWGGKVRKVIYGKTQRECQANAHPFAPFPSHADTGDLRGGERAGLESIWAVHQISKLTNAVRGKETGREG